MPSWTRGDVPMAVYDAIRKCVAFVGYPTERDGFSAEGTGFFVHVEDAGLDFGYLITARHVIDANRDMAIRINMKDGTSKLHPVPKSAWILHSKRSMDICALPTTINPDHADNDPHDITSLNIYNMSMYGPNIDLYTMSIGDEVFISGLFASRPGERKNIPIIRMANVSAMPEEPLWPYPTPCYLIETRSLGGTSGAPIFFNWTRTTLTRQMDPPRYGTTNAEGKNRVVVVMPYIFVGMILSSHARRFESDFPPETSALRDSEFNSGISVAMTAKDVIDFIKHDEGMVQHRNSVIERERQKIGHRPSSANQRHVLSPDANPHHREDFMSLLNAAAKTKKQGDQTSPDETDDSSGDS